MKTLDPPGRLVLISCLAVLVGAIVGCAGSAKDKARTVNDVADMACQIFAVQEAEEAQKQGFNVGDISKVVETACNVKDQARPFVDALLAAQRDTKVERAAAMGLNAEADGGAE